MIKKILIKSCFFIFFACSTCAAEERNIIENIRQIQRHSQESKLDELIDSTKEMQETAQEKGLGIDAETNAILANLKNPFTPQFPQKATPPPVPMPSPVETPHQEPIPSGYVPQPQQPPPAPPIEKPDFEMSGLVWNTVKPQAIINGQIVGVGDMVQEWKITAISKNGVEIKQADQKFVIEQKKFITSGSKSSNSNMQERNSVPPSPPKAGQARQRKSQSR